MDYEVGYKFHVDCLFDDGGVDCRGGMRLVDDVTVVVKPTKQAKKVLVFSPHLRADILLFKKDLQNNFC